MRDDLRLPDLTFPTMTYGKYQTPWNLNRWLYKGGAVLKLRQAAAAIRSGQLGDPLPERIELVQKIHEVLNGELVSGGSRETLLGHIETTNRFIRWAEINSHLLTLKDIQTTYVHWADHLECRWRNLKEMKQDSAHGQAKLLSSILGRVLELALPLITLTRLRKARGHRTVQGAKADKQNLKEVFTFGYFLQDICDGLSLDKMWGPLPVRIPLRSGGEVVLWSGVKPKDKLVCIEGNTQSRRSVLPKLIALRTARINDRTLKTRHSLANLRIEAELLMFIGQTGMNLSQAHSLKLQHFSYSTDGDFLNVREYKNRRGGEVLFRIYKEYKKHFERYLAWRRAVFPNSTKLFPTIRLHDSHIETPPTFALLKRHLGYARGVKYVGPQSLRATRVNWFKRHSRDPDLTAEEAQHSKEMLLDTYEIPSQQLAIGEVTRFWTEGGDPTLARTNPVAPVAPGNCDGVPVEVSFKPKDAPSPDCIRASGCLWCEHHRDVDSLDYVWGLASFRHLKRLEVGRYYSPQNDTRKHPAEFAIERLNAKLKWFSDSTKQRRDWVEEACARIDEEYYHPDWERLIQTTEGSAS